MSALAELQRRFASSLVDARAEPPAGASRRFAVHRANVRAGVASVLEARFPAVRRLVGDGFFAGMAAEFANAEPPASPVLLFYGAGFPAFVGRFAPASDVPYLEDVARLEWLLHEATHAADATPIGPADLAAVPPEAVSRLRLALHPSLRPYASAFPAFTIWKLNANAGETTAVKLLKQGEAALILRAKIDVEVRRIDAPMHDFCLALARGADLASAAEAATTEDGHAGLQTWLARLIAMGAIVGYDLATEFR